ncbi:MAG: tetratricopeptide repeat protein, partial [Fimbriimonadales bacterium]
DVQMERGNLCQRAERWPCAHEAFDAVIATDAEHMVAWYQVGRTAVLSGERLEEGVDAFRRYINEHTPRGGEPSTAWAHTRLGTLYEKLGRAEDARASYRAALALEPNHESAIAALAALK